MARDQDGVITPPHSVESEQSVLGGLLINNQSYDLIADKLYESDFFLGSHALVFRAISDLISSQKAADVITVAEYLDDRDLLKRVEGGLAYIGEVIQSTPSAANIEQYASIVRDRSIKRQLIMACGEVNTKALKPEGLTATDLLDFAQSKCMSIGEQLARQNVTMRPVSIVMDSVLDIMDELSKNPQEDDVTGLATGLRDLDKMTTGMQPGELIVLAARPSMGKTSCALNITENVALNIKKNVAFFSLEMINDQLGSRLLASVSKINQQRVKVARLNQDEWGKVVHAAERLKGANIYLDEESNIGVNEIRSRARRLHREAKGGLDLIVIDYLQLLQWPDSAKDEVSAYSSITRQLKLLAKELQIPVLVLSQLNRSLENRPNKRPVMSDLRGSGGIEQDADVILFIYRDQVYNQETVDKGIGEIIIGKQRSGPIGTVYTTFIDHLMRFEDLAQGETVPSIDAYHQSNSGRNFPRKNQYGSEG